MQKQHQQFDYVLCNLSTQDDFYNRWPIGICKLTVIDNHENVSIYTYK